MAVKFNLTANPKQAEKTTEHANPIKTSDSTVKFGSLTTTSIHTVAANTEKAGAVSDAKGSESTEKTTGETSDASIFEGQFSELADKTSAMSKTLEAASSAQPTQLNYAQAALDSATMLQSQAQTYMNSGNYEAAKAYLEQAATKLSEAQSEANKAGDSEEKTNLQDKISDKQSVVASLLTAANSAISSKTDSTDSDDSTKNNDDTSNDNSSCNKKGSCSGGGGGQKSQEAQNTPQNTAENIKALGEATKSLTDAAKSLKGDENKDLKYDKNAETAKDVEDKALPKHQEGVARENAANDKASEIQDKITENESKISSKETEKSTAEQKATEAKTQYDEQIAEKNKQEGIEAEHTNKANELQGKIEAKQGEIDTAQTELDDANNMPDEIQTGTNEDGTPIMSHNDAKDTAVANAEAKLNKLNEEKAQLEKEKEEETAKATEAKEKATEAETKAEEFNKTYTDETAKATAAGQEIDTLNSTNADLKSQLASLQTEANNGRDQQAAAQTTADDIEKRNK